MVYINTTGKHNEVWLDKPYATITVECPDCPSTEDAYSSGWTDGSEDGYHKGYQSGSTDGWSAGYPSGYTDGYGSGYTDGLSACSGGSCEEEWQDGYDSGYTDGSNSVDCTDFYNSGVTDGIAEQKAKLVSTAITENGTYTKEDGFSSVEVNVPTGQTINNQNKTLIIMGDDSDVTIEEDPRFPGNYSIHTNNGFIVTPDSGYTGLEKVLVALYADISSVYQAGENAQKAKMSALTVTANGEYNREDGWSAVTVNVPQTGQTINNQNISRDILACDLVYAAGHYMGNQTITHLPYYTGIEKVDLYIDINASAAIEQGYNSGYTSGYTDGLSACSGGNEDLIANLQGDYFIIPEGTTKLRNYAFYGTSLSSITIPSTVTEIGAGAFSSTNLTGITIPNSVSLINSNAFAGTGIEEITIPDTVLFLGSGVLQNTYSLTAATLPSGLTSIPLYLFQSSRLHGITLPTGITRIEKNAFGGCSLTGNLDIPAAVTGIGANAFVNVNTLSSMTFESTVPAVLSGTATYNASLGSTAYTWPIYVPCEAVDTYKTAWPIYAHRIECTPGNTNVLDLVYETSAANQTIRLFHGEAANHNGFFYAFYSGITKMVIDDVEVAKSEENIHHSYPSSADWYFYTFPTAGRHNVKLYVDRSFSAHTDTGWMFPAYELRDQLFGAYSLTLPEFPLVEAHIGEGYETIRGGVFQGNTNVTAVTLPSTIVSLYGYPFEYSGIHSIEIPDSVSAITTFQTSGTFNNCASLTSATFGTGITQIGNNTFSACTALTEITFNGVTPPTLLNANSLLTYGTDTFPIYVPASAVSAYQNEPSWADYASRVQAKP